MPRFLQEMASNKLSQCWQRFTKPYGVTSHSELNNWVTIRQSSSDFWYENDAIERVDQKHWKKKSSIRLCVDYGALNLNTKSNMQRIEGGESPYELCHTNGFIIKSLWPNDDVWHQTSWSTLVQVMAWCLFGTKPLPEPMLTYCQLES